MSTLKRLRNLCIVATGTALALIIGCDNYDYGGGFFGGGRGGSSSGFFDAGRRSPSLCDEVTEGENCYARSSSVSSCERGTSANSACNAHLQCGDGGEWTLEDAERSDCRTDCPAAYTETFDGCDGSHPGSLLCEYDQGLCGCAPVFDPEPDGGADAGEEDDAGGEDEDAGGPVDAGDAGDGGGASPPRPRGYEWRCVKPAATSATSDAGLRCPRLRPREGEECVRPMTCDYGACVFDDGYRMSCYSETWHLIRSKQCDR